MRSLINKKVLLTGFAVITCFFACKKNSNPDMQVNANQTNSFSSLVQQNTGQTNFVSDTDGFGANIIDSNLRNAWGIARAPNNGPIWISANHTGLSTIYDSTGHTLRAPVIVPSVTPGGTGAPTGMVFNGTTNFGGNRFIFASEDGIISAWKSGGVAVKVADRSQWGAVYKGLAVATEGGNSFLYATNFHGGTIDIFDSNFNYVATQRFVDPAIPPGYAPFNVQNIGGRLYVTYAKQGPDKVDDEKGPGNGYVDVFGSGGMLLKRFASRGYLNSPWGIALAPAGFADAQPTILIGNFGDGKINVFDVNGNFKGQLQNHGTVISIDGLWAIDFLKNNQTGGSPRNPLYFTAGPDDEEHGIFGSIQKH